MPWSFGSAKTPAGKRQGCCFSALDKNPRPPYTGRQYGPQSLDVIRRSRITGGWNNALEFWRSQNFLPNNSRTLLFGRKAGVSLSGRVCTSE
jgi:hypothetical protein